MGNTLKYTPSQGGRILLTWESKCDGSSHLDCPLPQVSRIRRTWEFSYRIGLQDPSRKRHFIQNVAAVRGGTLKETAWGLQGAHPAGHLGAHRRPRGDVRTVSSGKWLAISGLDGRGQVYTQGGAFSTLGLWGVPSRRTRCGCTSSVSPRDPADLGQVSWGGGALQGAV